MSPAESVADFNKLYLGDSLLQRIEVKIGEAECRLTFNAGRVLEGEGASIFEPEAEFAPALLRFIGVRTLSCEGGRYQLNSTMVDFGAVLSEHRDLIAFFLVLTGGSDPEDFMVKVKIEARGFWFGPVE